MQSQEGLDGYLPASTVPGGSATVAIRGDDQVLGPGVGVTGDSTVKEPKEDDKHDSAEEDEDKNGDNGDDNSVLSDGEDLHDDLDSALKALNFSGSFAVAKEFPQATNPGLTIEEIGLVSLPLAGSVARSIIASATRALYGHSTEVLANTNISNMWEIEPEKVSFQNPEWDAFVKSTVVPYVLEGLGVVPKLTPPRCELHKLLLYETGSHFLPHQDTQKAGRVFATIVIILPSAYTGGQVHVSHSGDTKVFDSSKRSMFGTSALAWYTDVTHALATVQSGYRLALSFNLIDTSPDSPTPSLPACDEALNAIQRVLRKWENGIYQLEDGDEVRQLAYILDHQYSECELEKGAKSLKGVDAYRVEKLGPVVERLGFSLYLAMLEYYVEGRAANYESKRCRYDDSSSDIEFDKDTSMREKMDDSMKVEYMVDLTGAHIPTTNFNIGENSLVPKDPFDGADPDEEEYEQYRRGMVEYWYRRTVLVFVPHGNFGEFLVSTRGMGYALSKLREAKLSAPPLELRQLAKQVISSLRNEDDVLAMLDIALKWRDFSLWQSSFDKGCSSRGYSFSPKPGILTSVLQLELVRNATEVFSFNLICILLEQIVDALETITEKIGRIRMISSTIVTANEAILIWCEEKQLKVLGSVVSPSIADVPILVEITATEGILRIMDIILPPLQRCSGAGMTPFWVAFINALRARCPQPGSPENPHSEAWKDAAEKSFIVAVDQWVAAYTGRSVPSDSNSCDPRVQSAIDLTNLGLSMRAYPAHQRILDTLLTAQGAAIAGFDTLYSRFLPQLRKVLQKYQLTITHPPFASFARRLIGMELRDVLGRPPAPMSPKVGCGCGDCAHLQQFLSSNRTQEQFQAKQSIRTHLEGKLHQVKHLVKWTTLSRGSPHVLLVQKGPELVARIPLNHATAFIRNFGDGEVATLMGNACRDVVKAIKSEGREPFKWSDADLAGMEVGAGSAQPSSAASHPVPANPNATARTSQQTTGTKRKRSEVQHKVYDLTGGG